MAELQTYAHTLRSSEQAGQTDDAANEPLGAHAPNSKALSAKTSDKEVARRSIVVTSDGPVACCCPLKAVEHQFRAYLARDLTLEARQCEVSQKCGGEGLLTGEQTMKPND